MNYNELIDKMTESILKHVRLAVDQNNKSDKTQKACIKEIINPRKYVVLINGETITATAHEDYAIDDWVWVTYPMNSVQNAFIVCKTQ